MTSHTRTEPSSEHVAKQAESSGAYATQLTGSKWLSSMGAALPWPCESSTWKMTPRSVPARYARTPPSPRAASGPPMATTALTPPCSSTPAALR